MKDPIDSPSLKSNIAGDLSTALTDPAVSLLDSLEEGVAVVESDGRLSYFNHALPTLLGLTSDELRAQGTLGIESRGVREDGSPFPEGGDPVQVVSESGLALSRALIRIRLPDHRDRWLSLNCRPLHRRAERGPWSVVASFSDVTQFRLTLEASRESEARFRAMADSAPVLISMTDGEGQCVYVNQGWVDLTGRTRDDLLARGWVQSIRPGDRNGFEEGFERARLARSQFSVERRLRRCDGIFRWTLLRGVPRFLGPESAPGYIIFGVDIEERRRAEARRSTMLETTRIFAESQRADSALSGLPEVAARHSGATSSDGSSVGLLSRREFEVLTLLAKGRGITQIAGDLAVSPKTVSTYRFRILEKLDLETNADLVRFAIEQQIIT